VSAWQLFLRSHTGTRNSIVADEGFPLVNEPVEIPVAEIHPLLGQLLSRVGAQSNIDRGKVREAGRVSIGFEVIDFAAGALQLDFGITASVVCAGIATQHLGVPLLLATRVGL
jgi:hypothetical protein